MVKDSSPIRIKNAEVKSISINPKTVQNGNAAMN